jgi:hypothetical protein
MLGLKKPVPNREHGNRCDAAIVGELRNDCLKVTSTDERGVFLPAPYTFERDQPLDEGA